MQFKISCTAKVIWHPLGKKFRPASMSALLVTSRYAFTFYSVQSQLPQLKQRNFDLGTMLHLSVSAAYVPIGVYPETPSKTCRHLFWCIIRVTASQALLRCTVEMNTRDCSRSMRYVNHGMGHPAVPFGVTDDDDDDATHRDNMVNCPH